MRLGRAAACTAVVLVLAFLPAMARGEALTTKRGSSLRSRPAYDWFWVWYEQEQSAGTQRFVVRPFYLKSGEAGSFFQAAFMPFLFWRYRTPEYDRWKWVFGFGQADDKTRDGKRDFDFGFFPLLFLGLGTDKSERYFFLWPIGGTMDGKFGTSRITAFIFPGLLLFVFMPPASIVSLTTLAWGALSLLPVYLSYEIGSFKAWSIMWPFLHYGRGDKREEIRIFPFYSHFHKEGWYDRYSFLFVFNYQRIYYSDDLHQVLFIFPLFGRKWSRSERMSSTTFLWPFFSWGYDRRIGDWELNIPWPLIQFKDCENPKIRKRIFFPVYGEYRYVHNYTRFITPLYFHLKKESPRFDSEQYFILLLFWHYRRDYHRAPDSYYGTRWRYFKFWPLFSVEYNDMGDRAFNLLSLLIFRDREGYEMLYQPFWSIVEYYRLRSGEQRLGLFMRLWFQQWGDGLFRLKLPFLLTIGRRENRLTEFVFFEYMLGYTACRKGRYLRLFWIPIRIGDSEGFSGDDDPAKEDVTHADGGRRPVGRILQAVGVTHAFSWTDGGAGSTLPVLGPTIAPREEVGLR